MQFFHRYPIQIRFSDIDLLNHVTNSVYQQYLDLGRLQYFSDVLQDTIDWNGDSLILVSVNVNFISQVRLHHKVEVRTKVVKLGNKSVEMKQQIFNLTTNEVAVESTSIMVGYHVPQGVSIPIPQRWRQWFTEFEKDMVFELQPN